MASSWTGSVLLSKYAEKSGLGTGAANLLRVLSWMNEIQVNICAAHEWPFLKFRLKKQFISGDQEIDISPQVPSTPTIAALAGGSLTDGSVYYVKVTFMIYDSTLLEANAIESEASAASNAITPTGANLSLTITALDTYDGTVTYEPSTIYRRIYLKKDSGDYIYYGQVANNTATTTTVTANSSSTIEPPEYSMVECLSSENPLNQANSTALSPSSLKDILNYDPALTSSGTPAYYARVSKKKIFVYPKFSSTKTLTYFVKRKPSRIFNDATRDIQLDPTLSLIFDAGMTWKIYEYKDSDGQESKLSNFEELKRAAIESLGDSDSQFSVVTEID